MTDLTYPRPVNTQLGPYGGEPTGQFDLPVAAEAVRSSRALFRWLAPSSLVPTYVGAVVIAAGFSLIGIAWAEVAGLTNVGLQMPYLVSAGFTGLALVMVGLIVINVAAKRQDGAERSRQMRALSESLQALQAEIAELDLPRRGAGGLET